MRGDERLQAGQRLIYNVSLPDPDKISRKFANDILKLDFAESDHARMAALSTKAHEGALSPDERKELEVYIDTSHFLALMHSKARQFLASGTKDQMSNSPAHEPSPALFFDTVNAFQRSSAIRAAIDLDLFSIIAEGKRTAGEIARRCNAAERGVRILCDYLTVNGFLIKRGSNYELTADSATFLDRKSPAYSGGIVEFLQTPELLSMFSHLTEAVRRGGMAQQNDTVEGENPVWVKFARAMAPLMFPLSQQMAQLLNGPSTAKIKVLDIAAGHGLYGIAIAKANPNAQIVALDWPSVVAVAKENAAHMGVGDRFQTIGGSAFEVDLGRDYDLVLLPNFLHHFDVPTCEKLLKRVYAASAPGGRAAALEFIPNEDRVSPPPSATFALVMLATTRAGDAYTYPELASMFRNAGFAETEFQPMDPLIERMVIAMK